MNGGRKLVFNVYDSYFNFIWKNLGMFSRLLNKNDFIFDIIHCIQLMGVDEFSLDWLQQ